MKTVSPTNQTYQSLLYAYNFFNQALFDTTLPPVVFTYHRQNRVMGYASFERWVNQEKQFVDEIAINPEYFAKFPLMEICQTLVHEMCHIWQAHHGKPGRRGYHNQEWADKMISIGLMPSSSGKPGGNKTGESMMDYVLLDGKFLRSSRRLVRKGFAFPLLDRYPIFRHEVPIVAFDDNDNPIDLDNRFEVREKHAQPMSAKREDNLILAPETPELTSFETSWSDNKEPMQITAVTTRPRTKSGRVKYICKSCQTYVWAKRGLNIGCLDCELKFQEEG
jgi:predicted SprT family Zn-dependent metalloprotease